MSHDELVIICSNIPELVDAVPSIASRAALTGKLLMKKDTVEKLQGIGLEDPDVAEVFLDYYLHRWDKTTLVYDKLDLALITNLTYP